MYDLYLEHHGIKGMKWGIRRYQNKDGSLTAAGKKRASRDQLEGGKKGKKPNPDRWVKEDLERTKRLTDVSNNMVGQLKSANNKKATKKQTMDLSNMTDQEMRSQINRKLLERQYNDLFAPETTSKGRDRVNSVLETSGTVLAIGSSALGIALAIKELRG